MRIVRDIQDGRADPRTLEPKQRRAVLAILADGRFSTLDLANILKTTRKKIELDLIRMRRELGAEIVSWDTATAVGYLAAGVDRCYAQAMHDGDVGLANSIRSGFVRQLKELGVIGPKDANAGVKITLEMVGDNLQRATEALEQAFNPLLSGERLDPRTVEGKKVETPKKLPLNEVIPSEDTSPPEIHVKDAGS